MNNPLNPSQNLVVEQISNSNYLLTEQAAKAIEVVGIVKGVGIGTVGTGGATIGLGALGVGGATVTGIGILVLGGAVIVGGLGYGGFAIWRSCENDKIRAHDLEQYVNRRITANIWLSYFKDEVKNERKSDIMKYMEFDRDHEAIESYIKYLTESIIEPEQMNDQDLIQKLNQYKNRVELSIKPEEITHLSFCLENIDISVVKENLIEKMF